MNAPLPPPPDFERPPVVEVALSVQFAPLSRLHVAHFGLLWQIFRDRFPKTQEYPPLNRTVEEFGVRQAFGIGIRLELLDEPVVPRCWFLNEQETELIQVQRDRLIVNWRAGGDGEQYPHFDRVEELFRRAYTDFEAFAQREDLGAVVPDQCEVTYIDHIAGDGVWEHHGQMGNVFTVWSAPPGTPLPAEPENVRMAMQYVIPGDDGQPLGRLHIDIQPAYRRSDDMPIIVLTTTGRGQPVGDGLEGVLEFFGTGRSWAVGAFTGLTSPRMHQAWGKRDD